jgi:hypothetical protein
MVTFGCFTLPKSILWIGRMGVGDIRWSGLSFRGLIGTWRRMTGRMTQGAAEMRRDNLLQIYLDNLDNFREKDFMIY